MADAIRRFEESVDFCSIQFGAEDSRRQGSRWDHARRRSLVFELLERSEFDSHITHSVPFGRLPDIYNKLKAHPTEGLSYLVKYHEKTGE